MFLAPHNVILHALNPLFKHYVTLKVVDFKPFAPHLCGFESQQGHWILSCEEAILWNVSDSTLVPVCVRNNARKGT
jgi:hypothetical protein